jgi:hypothetical protein
MHIQLFLRRYTSYKMSNRQSLHDRIRRMDMEGLIIYSRGSSTNKTIVIGFLRGLHTKLPAIGEKGHEV